MSRGGEPMASFEEERLLILGRVQAGELTPQEGSLQIAMLKVKSQEGASAAADDDAHGPRAVPPARPNPIALGALLLVPFVVMGLIVLTTVTFFMVLPAWLGMLAWNALVVPAVPGAEAVGFLQTLAVFVAFSVLWTLLRWRRKVRVFMAGGAGVGGAGLNPGGGFREQ